jgi:Holliday junction DNA helicase RuvA
MISGLAGTVFTKLDRSVVIDVQGVRYELEMSSSSLGQLPRLGQTVELWTRLVPSDDALTLYGFANEEERKLFDLLTSVSGVGPRLALNILSSGPVDQIVARIVQEKPEEFLKVSRLGRKTASRLILELKGKIEQVFPKVPMGLHTLDDVESNVALEALVGLGYTLNEAKIALSKTDQQDVSAQVKEALRYLSNRQVIH